MSSPRRPPTSPRRRPRTTRRASRAKRRPRSLGPGAHLRRLPPARRDRLAGARRPGPRRNPRDRPYTARSRSLALRRVPRVHAACSPPQRPHPGAASARVAGGGAGPRPARIPGSTGPAYRSESCRTPGSCEDGRPWCGHLAASRPEGRPPEGLIQELGSQEARARARQGARDDQQGDARSLRVAGDRREDALLEHRGRAGRSRPSQGRARGPRPRRPARGARQGGQGGQEGHQGDEGGHPGRAARRRTPEAGAAPAVPPAAVEPVPERPVTRAHPRAGRGARPRPCAAQAPRPPRHLEWQRAPCAASPGRGGAGAPGRHRARRPDARASDTAAARRAGRRPARGPPGSRGSGAAAVPPAARQAPESSGATAVPPAARQAPEVRCGAAAARQAPRAPARLPWARRPPGA